MRSVCRILVALLFSTAAFGAMPASQHVFLVVEENHSYSSVIGNPAMPYLNSLVSQFGLATHYYANTHPSIGNYFMLTTGQIVTNDDTFTGVINVDDAVTHLLSASKTWKSYAESLPYAGYTGGDAYPYLKRHNPFSYFSDVVNSGQKQNLVPFTQFATDLANNQLPNFSFIVPNALDDAHDGTLAQADAWLAQNIAPLLASRAFQTDGVLILVFDESSTSDNQGGGGHVAALVIGPQVQPGFQATTTYQHPSTLKSLLQALGVTSYPGAAQSAPDMGEFFEPPPPPPTPSFTLTVTPATASVKAGQAAAFTVAVSPLNGFQGTLAFSCTGLPAGAGCTFSPNTITLGGPANVALSLTTTGPSLAALLTSKMFFGFCLPVLGIAFCGESRKRKKFTFWSGVIVLLVAAGLTQTGCGGSHNGGFGGTTSSPGPTSQTGTPPGTYTVTVAATSGSIQQTAAIRLVVQ